MQMPSRENKPKKSSPNQEPENYDEQNSNTGLYMFVGVAVLLVAITAIFITIQ
jgi:hypothetical protein